MDTDNLKKIFYGPIWYLQLQRISLEASLSVSRFEWKIFFIPTASSIFLFRGNHPSPSEHDVVHKPSLSLSHYRHNISILIYWPWNLNGSNVVVSSLLWLTTRCQGAGAGWANLIKWQWSEDLRPHHNTSQQPIREQYLGHVTWPDQSEASEDNPSQCPCAPPPDPTVIIMREN